VVAVAVAGTRRAAGQAGLAVVVVVVEETERLGPQIVVAVEVGRTIQHLHMPGLAVVLELSLLPIQTITPQYLQSAAD
jgi:hypothetical protein